MQFKQLQRGFALPVVVITSVIMFAILIASVGAVASTSANLDIQYYDSLASDVAESGAMRIADCIEESTYTIGVNVYPNTDCYGNDVSGRSEYELNMGSFRTKYTAKVVSSSSQTQYVDITGNVERIRASGVVFTNNVVARKLKVSMVIDPNGDRANQRFWYFGERAVLDFGAYGSNLPTPSRNNGSSNPIPRAYEGTTIVSDANGNLQFWSDGLTIWNKSGNVMDNASGLNGANSAVQAVASFPLNKARTKYAVVSNSSMMEYGPGELYLSVIDLTLNGGDGRVTSKNVRLGGTNYAYEGLGAMPNSDGTGYYVFAYHARNKKITSFLIKTDLTVTGPFEYSLSPNPIVCDIANSGMSGYGTFNFTKSYDRMVLFSGSGGCSGSVTGTAYLFSTNLATGSISKLASWTTHSSGYSGSGYSADFSPEGRYLYVTSIYPSYLSRYDLQDLPNIGASEWKIGILTNETGGTAIWESGGQIRRGPDNRMYISDRARYYMGTTPCQMSYINNPDASTNSSSAIGLNIDGITLPSGACPIWGLPQMATVFKPKILLY